MHVLYGLCLMFGWDPVKTWTAILGLMPFLCEYRTVRRVQGREFPIKRIYPCLSDMYSNCGDAPRHYFLQDIAVARRVFENNPIRHVDVGSRLDGFIAHQTGGL